MGATVTVATLPEAAASRKRAYAFCPQSRRPEGDEWADLLDAR